MDLKDIRDALLTVTPHVYHFRAQKQEGPYIVWGESGPAASLYDDDQTHIQAMAIEVDYFTPLEYDQTFAELQNLFNNLDVAWRLEYIRYEDASYEEGQHQIHYSWTLETVIWTAED